MVNSLNNKYSLPNFIPIYQSQITYQRQHLLNYGLFVQINCCSSHARFSSSYPSACVGSIKNQGKPLGVVLAHAFKCPTLNVWIIKGSVGCSSNLFTLVMPLRATMVPGFGLKSLRRSFQTLRMVLRSLPSMIGDEESQR